MDRIAQSCEYLLVAAAEHASMKAEWSVRGRSGREYRARLVVDEWNDCPVVELVNPETDRVVQRFGLKLSCWRLQ